jgi:hypothetical protein
MMHVGCARYYQRVPGTYPSSRSVYFYPPRSFDGDWAFNIFCPEHAEDLVKADFPDASLVCYPVASKVTAVANETQEPQLPQSNNAAVAGSTSARKRRRVFDDDDDDEASLEDGKPAAARSSAAIGVHDLHQVADNLEDNENAGLPAHTCRGVTLDSLVADRELNPSAVQQVVGRLMSQAVHTRAKAIGQGTAWPLKVAEWHGALFRSDEKEPWWYVSGPCLSRVSCIRQNLTRRFPQQSEGPPRGYRNRRAKVLCLARRSLHGNDSSRRAM